MPFWKNVESISRYFFGWVFNMVLYTLLVLWRAYYPGWVGLICWNHHWAFSLHGLLKQSDFGGFVSWIRNFPLFSWLSSSHLSSDRKLLTSMEGEGAIWVLFTLFRLVPSLLNVSSSASLSNVNISVKTNFGLDHLALRALCSLSLNIHCHWIADLNLLTPIMRSERRSIFLAQECASPRFH